MEKTSQFGLVGRNIAYSFSKGYFAEKFQSLGLEGYRYDNFDIDAIDDFPGIITANPNLKGLNVTIPYKEAVIPFLDDMSKKATAIGAVNTIKFTKEGRLKGYNTDAYGFRKSLQPLLQPHHRNALILGTGGAAKAVAFALKELGMLYTFVSREDRPNTIGYNQINATSFDNFQLIVNCTPLGTSPEVANFPDIPYEQFTPEHIAFDLIYNPGETVFLKRAKSRGAVTMNGYDMLVFQAEKAWKIWRK